MNVNKLFKKNLGSHERLIWVGRPKQGIMLRPNDIFFIPFSILWGGLAIFWEVMALTSLLKGAEKGGPTVLIFPIFGIPFVTVGLYLIFGRFIVDAKQRGNTCAIPRQVSLNVKKRERKEIIRLDKELIF